MKLKRHKTKKETCFIYARSKRYDAVTSAMHAAKEEQVYRRMLPVALTCKHNSKSNKMCF